MSRLNNLYLFLNDEKGRTLPKAKLFFYENNSFDFKNTYADKALTSVNPNPVIADGAGRFPNIFLEADTYRVVLQDEDGVEISTKDDVDNLLSDGDNISNTTVTTSTGSQTLAGALDDRVVRVGSVAGLKALDVSGFTGNEGARITATLKKGDFYWNPSSTLAPDDVTILLPDSLTSADPGRWERDLSVLLLSDWWPNIGASLDYLFNYTADIFTNGGAVKINRGFTLIDSEILIDRTAGGADESDNLTIYGEGPGTSELRASGSFPVGDSIIKTNEPAGGQIQQLNLRDFSLRGGKHCIEIETASRTNFERLKLSGASDSGLYVGNSYVNNYQNILSDGHGLHGVEFAINQQKTSTNVNAGYATNNAASGWFWGFMNYCTANAVASDVNGLHGHNIQKSDGFVLTGIGAESNGRAGIWAEASATIGENKNVLIQGAFMHSNNTTDDGYANLLHVKSTGGTRNEITIRNSKSSNPLVGGPNDIIVDGVGAVVTVDNCEMPNSWGTVNGGYVDWVHHSKLFPNITYTAGAANRVCYLRSTQGYADTYGGLVTVNAGNVSTSNGTRRTATYLLLVNKTLGGVVTVNVVSEAGETDGTTSNSAPSFTWSIDGTDGLIATAATASIAGDFWFEVTTDSQVVAMEDAA